MSDYQRVKQLLDHLQLSARAFSLSLGLASPQIFYDIKAGKCGVSKDLALKIQEKYVNVNSSWLLTGEGEMLKDCTVSTIAVDKSTVAPETNSRVNVRSATDITLRFIELLAEKDRQISKSQEQIDRLLTMIEGDRGR